MLDQQETHYRVLSWNRVCAAMLKLLVKIGHILPWMPFSGFQSILLLGPFTSIGGVWVKFCSQGTLAVKIILLVEQRNTLVLSFHLTFIPIVWAIVPTLTTLFLFSNSVHKGHMKFSKKVRNFICSAENTLYLMLETHHPVLSLNRVNAKKLKLLVKTVCILPWKQFSGSTFIQQFGTFPFSDGVQLKLC